MKKKMFLSLLFLGFISIPARLKAQQPVSMHSLLTEMIDRSAVTRWPEPAYRLQQASSYDRRSTDSTSSGWFANGDQGQYIRTEKTGGRNENVMMDTDGPGAIVRFWLTTTKKTGILRIYLDGHAEADLEIPAFDLMKIPLPLKSGLLDPHSSYNAVDKGGNTLYFPIPYRSHCKITLEETGGERLPRYYQINYRTYPAGTNLVSFTKAGFEKEKTLIAKVESALSNTTTSPPASGAMKTNRIAGRDSISTTISLTGAAISEMRISLKTNRPADYENALHQTWIKILFDGNQAVLCPLDDFSGSGAGAHDLQSWYRGVKAGEILSRWIMPFQKSASVTFINRGDSPVSVTFSAATTTYKWTAGSMYFHASAQEVKDLPIKKTDGLSDTVTPGSANAPAELNFCRVSGKGVYMGHTLDVFNKMHYWYGEGDQKIWTDSGKFPAEFGTGTEDYYNTSWAPVILYQTAFANAPRADNADSYGWNTFTRTRILDAVPFSTDFQLDWEGLGWRDGTIDISTVAYWYQLP